MSRARELLFVVLWPALAFPGTALAADCAKSVFNRFCLGGPASSLSAAAANVPFDGDLTLLDEGRPVHVELRAGRIFAVAREEPPGSWINYIEWRNRLIRIYGRGEDRSDFPPSSRSRSARHNAVVTGKGRAETHWEQDGWQVAVIWNHPDFIVLRYRLNDGGGDDAGATEGL